MATPAAKPASTCTWCTRPPAQDGVEQAQRALRKLQALMPALPVEERLLEDGLWLSFMSDQHAFR